MPQVRITPDTLALISANTLPGYTFRSTAVPDPEAEGMLLINLGEQLCQDIDRHRLPGETDDQALSRLIRWATDTRPH